MQFSATQQSLKNNEKRAQTSRSAITPESSGSAARFRGLALTSHLQPIFSLAHQHAVGYEGLVRCTSSKDALLSPLKAFARCRKEDDVVTMDRLCRALHLRNFAARKFEGAWLCINVNSRVIRKSGSEDALFSQLLEELGLSADRIVVVISGSAGRDDRQTKSWVDYYRGLGCQIALKAFASGNLNFDGIWRLNPDFVMLERSLIAAADANPTARAMLPRIVSMIHEAGALVILQGIESAQEAKIAMDADVDFVQGYYFAHPGPTGEPDEFCDRIENMIAAAYRVRADAVAKAQAEMMTRVQAEQQAIAELRESAVAEAHAKLCAPLERAQLPHHLMSRGAESGSFPKRRLLIHMMQYFSDVTLSIRHVPM